MMETPSMIRSYCTLFDSDYLARGLVLYESLMKHSSEDFRLYVLPMDDHAYNVLTRLVFSKRTRFDRLRLAPPDILAPLKEGRSHQEYCWTAASNFLEYVFKYFFREPGELVYLDADMMFFADPKIVFDEIGDR